ncbi:hypothetical protein D7W81_28130 [Corallococcus aberystwythensis]|uniref:Uncharacterized protein n=1 Tax=Corallococcus aberystwythensis TaxID=2316722 RepID=A0A3A8PRP1_9BACT|nr:hypothetical protein D7W81_28130 [Corallococcus aberystwythensis]
MRLQLARAPSLSSSGCALSLRTTVTGVVAVRSPADATRFAVPTDTGASAPASTRKMAGLEDVSVTGTSCSTAPLASRADTSATTGALGMMRRSADGARSVSTRRQRRSSERCTAPAVTVSVPSPERRQRRPEAAVTTASSAGVTVSTGRASSSTSPP